MALSYMRGPGVSDWARDKGTWTFNQVYGAPQRNPNEIGLWTEFEQSFNNTFLDTTKVEEATRSLDALRMTGTNLEDYNAQFSHLLGLTGWEEDTKGTIEKYKRGLKEQLRHNILMHDNPMTNYLEDWKNAARQRHRCYMEMMNDKAYGEKGTI